MKEVEGGLEKSAPAKNTSSSLSSSPASGFPADVDRGGRENATRNRSEDGRLRWRESIPERRGEQRENGKGERQRTVAFSILFWKA